MHLFVVKLFIIKTRSVKLRKNASLVHHKYRYRFDITVNDILENILFYAIKTILAYDKSPDKPCIPY